MLDEFKAVVDAKNAKKCLKAVHHCLGVAIAEGVTPANIGTLKDSIQMYFDGDTTPEPGEQVGDPPTLDASPGAGKVDTAPLATKTNDPSPVPDPAPVPVLKDEVAYDDKGVTTKEVKPKE